MRVAAAGLAPGFLGALGLTRFLESLLVVRRRRPLVTVRVCRALRLRHGILLQLRHDELDRPLELWVLALPDQLRIVFDFDVRRHAHVLGVPLAFGAPDAGARSRDDAAVHQRRRARAADQAAPGPLSDELADAGAAEVRRHGIAAGARE